MQRTQCTREAADDDECGQGSGTRQAARGRETESRTHHEVGVADDSRTRIRKTIIFANFLDRNSTYHGARRTSVSQVTLSRGDATRGYEDSPRPIGQDGCSRPPDGRLRHGLACRIGVIDGAELELGLLARIVPH